MDKIEFEELALRRVDLAVTCGGGAEKEKEALETSLVVSLDLSFCFLSDSDPMLPNLRSHCSTHRH